MSRRARSPSCTAAVAGMALAVLLALQPVQAQQQAPADLPRLGLAELYQQSRTTQPRLKAAEAAYQSSLEQVQQARAQLRPNVVLSASRFNNRLDSTVPGLLGDVSSQDRYTSRNESLQLRQPLYRPQQWAAVQSAEKSSEAAQAQRDQEFGQMANRVALVWFDNVLSAAQLQAARELVEALRQQLVAAQRVFAAGQGVRTDVDEVQAQLDSAQADLVEAEQYVASAGQELAALRGNLAAAVLAPRLDRLEALLPGPGRELNDWLVRARDNNAEMRQLRAQRDAALEDIARAEAGHKPTLDLILQRQRSGNENVTRLRSTFDTTSLGVQFNLPLYAGGANASQVRQALADADRTQFTLDALQLDLDSRVRKEHRTVVEGLARHRALQQALTSARTALASAERSFTAGVRTRTDIARALQRVAQQQRELVQAACATLLARLRLEVLASGTEDEVAAAVAWMDGVLR